MEAVHVEMHGVRLVLSSDFSPLPRYVALHLPHHSASPAASEKYVPQIEIQVRWHTDPQFSTPPSPRGLEKVGKRVFMSLGELRWTETVRVENLSWLFRLHGEKLAIEADYVYAPRAEKLAANPHYLERKLFSLTSWLVLHPLTWYLEHFRGFHLLHASCVEFGGRGIVVAGLGGAGKTTTAIALVARGGRLLSENLLFFDDERVYSYYEPVRLDGNSVELLRARPGILQGSGIPEGAKSKHLYHLHRDAIANVAMGTLLFLPRFGESTSLASLEASACAERLLAMNGQTREVDDYEWFAAVPNLAWPLEDSLARRSRTMRRFLERMDCFDLRIDKRRGVEAVTQLILQQTNAARESREA